MCYLLFPPLFFVQQAIRIYDNDLLTVLHVLAMTNEPTVTEYFQ